MTKNILLSIIFISIASLHAEQKSSNDIPEKEYKVFENRTFDNLIVQNEHVKLIGCTINGDLIVGKQEEVTDILTSTHNLVIVGTVFAKKVFVSGTLLVANDDSTLEADTLQVGHIDIYDTRIICKSLILMGNQRNWTKAAVNGVKAAGSVATGNFSSIANYLPGGAKKD